MTEQTTISKRISIRDAGKDEYWLQNEIYNNPSCLGLGDLVARVKEKRQSSGGRLDILLENPEDDAMYEVEVMLGKTDESHIIRTIEYWDNEKRLRPQRKHYAVLVAETVNKRFFNVVHLLSYSIPIIAIQVSLLQYKEEYSLFFTTILNTYEEVEDKNDQGRVETKDFWIKDAKWVVESAEYLNDVYKNHSFDTKLGFTASYISVSFFNTNRIWFYKRRKGKSWIDINVKGNFQDAVCEKFDEKNITAIRKEEFLCLNIDKNFLENNNEVLLFIAEKIKEQWE